MFQTSRFDQDRHCTEIHLSSSGRGCKGKEKCIVLYTFLLHHDMSSREIKSRAFRMRCFFILSFQLCCLAVLCLRRSYLKYLKNKTKCWPLFNTVPPAFSSKICKKTKRNARPFQLGNNLRPICGYCVVGFLPKDV